LHARDARGAASPKEDPIMSQLDELSSDTAMANDVRAANMACHRDLSTAPNSPTSQEVRL
jgi:hypothetical protein